MDDETRRELDMLRADVVALKRHAETLRPWSKNIETMQLRSRFQGDVLGIAAAELLCRVAMLSPDPSLLMGAMLKAIDETGTSFSGAAEPTSAEGSNEAAIVAARLRDWGNRRLTALRGSGGQP